MLECIMIEVESLIQTEANRSAVRVSGPWGNAELYIQGNVPLVNNSMSSWLPALLPIAMSLNTDLYFKGNLNYKAMNLAGDVQQLLCEWFPKFKVINVFCDGYESNVNETSEMGTFFTGGVDSFYSVLTPSRTVTKLIYVHGFDVPLSNVKMADTVEHELQASADALEKDLIVMRTNIREFADKYVSWGQEYHGAALASIGLSLSLKEVYIASSFNFESLHPWGSHPDLDHLWSTDNTSIIHDSVSVSRVEKVRKINESAIAMKYLRVCWKNTDNRYNCGSCEKCLRTMINLLAVNGLTDCETLPNKIHLKDLTGIRIYSRGDLVFLEENLTELKKLSNSNEEIILKIEMLIRKNKLKIISKYYIKSHLPLFYQIYKKSKVKFFEFIYLKSRTTQ
jgi:hypothetical protein